MDDPLIFDYTPRWPVAASGEPGVTVCALSCTADPGGRRGILSVAPWRVPPDFAGDLAHQAQAFTESGAVYSIWFAGAIGFIEAEALDALNGALMRIGQPPERRTAPDPAPDPGLP